MGRSLDRAPSPSPEVTVEQLIPFLLGVWEGGAILTVWSKKTGMRLANSYLYLVLSLNPHALLTRLRPANSGITRVLFMTSK